MDDVIAYFPEMEAEFLEIVGRVEEFEEVCNHSFEQFSGLPDKKEFALKVKSLPISPVLFALWDRKIQSPEEYLKRVTPDSAIEILERVVAG
jgi:hypothetical protein